MISTFNLSKLESLLKDFYNLTKIRITVFDDAFHELTAYPPQISTFCRIIRTDASAARQCALCDENACEAASHRHTSYSYQCHAGLTESIMPLSLGNIVIGYLFFGQVFSYPDHETGWHTIQKKCADYHIDKSALKAACLESPLISKDYIASASQILQAVAAYLCIERMAVLRHEKLPVQIDDYISAHFTEELDTPSICRQFQIGKTRLYEISRQNYGCGIAEHIRKLRIEKAKALLTDQPQMKISEIASACGFSDYNYFITVFKRVAGMPPKKYQETML